MGYLYLATSDKHLLVKDEKILLARGPVENRWRPSIDTLFRSAAAAYNSRVIGVILSSLLQGGTAGMTAIKKSGGTCIVQYPAQAEYPDMPNSVLSKEETSKGWIQQAERKMERAIELKSHIDRLKQLLFDAQD